MRIETERRYRCGFNINEQELRRIIDTSIQQMEKVCLESYDLSIEVKLKNGVISKYHNLDDIFSLENVGTNKIIQLIIYFSEENNDHGSMIKLDFLDVDTRFSIFENVAISYVIRGVDRDWVFITSSLMEERISRIKRFAPNQLVSWFFMNPLYLFLILMAVMFFVAYLGKSTSPSTLQQLIPLENKWKDGEITDPIHFIIEFEKVKLGNLSINERLGIILNNRTSLTVMIVVGLIIIGIIIWIAFFPVYNFIWGDYEVKFERRKKTGRFIIITVIIGIIIGIISNYMTSILGIVN